MTRNNSVENVLILQGGGSLGAFGCGVFKAIAESQVKIDILAGTSIGGINAAIIAGSRDKRPESALEQFWLELAENSIDLAPSLTHPIPPDPGNNKSDSYYSRYYQQAGVPFRQALSFYSSAIYGNSMMFLPRWRPEYVIKDPKYFRPTEWTYIYDHSPLALTLEKYINYDKLRPGRKSTHSSDNNSGKCTDCKANDFRQRTSTDNRQASAWNFRVSSLWVPLD